MSSRRARHSRLMRVAESLDARRLLSTTLFSTGFEAAQNGTSFTSYNYAANTNLTGLPTSPPANTVRFTSMVAPDITGELGFGYRLHLRQLEHEIGLHLIVAETTA